MNRYALIGYPLGHSLSPQIHERLFQLEGLTGEYRLQPFPPEQLAAQVPALKTLTGFNVTIPYKQAIIPYLSELSESARLYGAVNTVHCVDDRLVGSNTDCDGFLRTMAAHGVSLTGDICILGAGGVGRMFAIECARQGASVTLAIRESTQQKAAVLAQEVAAKTGASVKIQMLDSLKGPFHLIINATPVGMFPKVDACPVPLSVVEQTDVVFDCIYNPAETVLLRHARELHKQAIGGMGMLVWQAVAAHEIWHGTTFDTAHILPIVGDMYALL